MDKQKHYLIKTLGCKANWYDTQALEAQLQQKGWKPFTDTTQDKNSSIEPDLCIVNSCTVTDEADRQSRRMATQLSKEFTQSRVVLTGCGAEVDPQAYAKTTGLSFVVGNQNKPGMVDLLLSKVETTQPTEAEILGSVSNYEQLLSRHPQEREWPLAEDSFTTPPVGTSLEGLKTRAFLKIQEGCNSFCTYCIIPYGRGPARSLRPKEVLKQVQHLVSQGVREVVITGTNIGDFGIDWGVSPDQAVADLFELILSETQLERLRVGSLDPTEITPALISLMQREPRFCPHFHVSLQATQDRTLKQMKRKYGNDQVRECLNTLANLTVVAAPIFVGMDVITGFPGETREEFEASLLELSQLPWTRLHVFPYSERKGTPATRLPGSISIAERLKRSRELNQLSLKRVTERYETVLRGSKLKNVLLERPVRKPPQGKASLIPSPYWVQGYSPNYMRVVLPISEAQAVSLRNQVVEVDLLSVEIDSGGQDAYFLAQLSAENTG